MIKYVLAFGFLLTTSCTHMLYYPQKGEIISPRKFNLTYEEVWLDAGGEKIHAWWFPAKLEPKEKAKGTVLLFHGNAENMTTHFMNLAWMPGQGYNYMIFDYPGYGASSGKPTQKGTVESGRAALHWLWANKDKRVIIFGHSLGGAIALRTVEDERANGEIRAVILEDTFSNYHQITAKVLRRSFLTWLLSPLAYVLVSNEYGIKKMSSLDGLPVLVIHGQEDQVVEPEFGERIYDELKEPKQIIRVPHGDHGNALWIDQGKYRDEFLEFLEKHP